MSNHSKKAPLWKRFLQVVGVACLVLVAAGVGAGVAAYMKLDSSVQSEDFTDYLDNRKDVKTTSGGSTTDPNAGRSLNYVLIGSDSREGGDNSSLGGGAVDGMRSDTTIIAHVSEDRKRVDMVSIPRDSMVEIPSCKKSDGARTDAKALDMFNSAFSKGDNTPSAVACTVATIEKNTGLYIDGYAVVDFSGFKDMVDSIGGIEFNVPRDMVSKKAKLDLKAGKQTLNGTQALAYARARTFEVGGGDGSDISRIERQQELLKAFASQILSAGTLSNPVKIYNVSDSVIKSLTVSPDLGSVNSMTGFAYSLRNISKNDINFYTVPNTRYPQDLNRVIWTDEADEYWAAMNDDKPLESDKSSEKKTG